MQVHTVEEVPRESIHLFNVRQARVSKDLGGLAVGLKPLHIIDQDAPFFGVRKRVASTVPERF